MRAIAFVDYENIWKGLTEQGYSLIPEQLIQVLNRYAEKHGLDLLAVYVYANFDREEFWRTQTLFQKTNMITRHVFSKNSFANTDLRNNAADLELMLEAQEFLLTRLSAVEVFLLITGDGDFFPLVRKIRAWGKEVRVIGIDGSIHHSLQPYCEHYDVFGELLDQVPKEEYDPAADIRQALHVLGQMQIRMAYVASTKARTALMEQLGRTVSEVKELIRYALRSHLLIEKEYPDASLKIGRTKIYLLNLQHSLIQELFQDTISDLTRKQTKLLEDIEKL